NAQSPLRGAAVVAFRIPGVLHEFSSIPGVKEDIIDISMNLKQIVFMHHGKDRKKLKLVANGPCVVTAGMIETVDDIQVINKDLLICTLDKQSKIEMELIIDVGKGYVPASENKIADAPIDMIAIDSIFSPVKRVSYNIENVRVGSRTDYDKLSLNIETNGS